MSASPMLDKNFIAAGNLRAAAGWGARQVKLEGEKCHSVCHLYFLLQERCKSIIFASKSRGRNP